MSVAARYRSVFFLVFFAASAAFSQTDDQAVCNRVLSFAFERKLIEKPIGDIIAEVGKKFLGSPYIPGTLDSTSDEHLVVNLRAFDCVTFVENVLALSLAIKSNTLSFDAYKENLRTIRYRGGKMNGYVSRLHYFSDWIHDNEAKGILKDVTREIGGEPYGKTINFMTTHRSVYSKLANDSIFASMKTVEDSLAHRQMFVIRKSNIKHLISGIHNGDIIAITTSTEGLDISHTGIAVRTKDGTLHYMHAPNAKGTVKITDEPLDKYLMKNKLQTGVLVVSVLK